MDLKLSQDSNDVEENRDDFNDNDDGRKMKI